MALLLRKRGVERVRPLAGGFRAWRDRGYPMTKLTPAPAFVAARVGGVYA